MAAHAVDILGESLAGLAIGNEPSGYTVDDVPSGAVRGKGWNKDKYVDQLGAYAKVIHAKRPEAPIIGPDVYDGAWMDAFVDSGVKHKTAIAQHWYQLYECDSTKVPSRGAQAANLIDPLAKQAANKNLGIGKDKADAAWAASGLEKTGPTSCPDTNDTSLTNASALWAADYTMYPATLGVEGMATHSMLGACNGGAPYRHAFFTRMRRISTFARLALELPRQSRNPRKERSRCSVRPSASPTMRLFLLYPWVPVSSLNGPRTDLLLRRHS